MVQNLENKLSLGNRERFGSKSQKGPSKPKEKPGRTHQQDKDDFDGTPDSLGGDGPAPDSQAGEKAVGKKTRTAGKLNILISNGHPPRRELMEKAVLYLDAFWEQLFRYTDNGRYSMDNNIAERNIRPLAGERKNSLFFGSHRMAEASAAYHTAIATCLMAGVSVLEYFKRFFRRIIEGERNYSLLMPQTI